MDKVRDSTAESSSSASSPVNFPQQFSLHSWSNIQQQSSVLAMELQQLPTAFMVNVLEEMSHQPELANLQREILSDPYNVSKILQFEPRAREKLVTYFQWLDKSSKGSFVWEMVSNFCLLIASSSKLEDSHPLGFNCNLELGKFLSDAGWYTEAIILLNIAKEQADGRPFEQLKVLRIMLMAESLSSRHGAACHTIYEMHMLMTQTKGIPMSLTAALHYSLAVSYFEKCEFDASYQQGLLALQLLDENSCPYEIIIAIFRQLAKCCIAKKRTRQAKLLITQAVSWAWHNFGSSSVMYAEALEDYAFYLLMMNAYQDCVKVESEVKNIYFNLYGYLCLQPELAQGNLAFRLYLESCEYYEFGPVDQYMDYVVDSNQQRTRINRSDDRQMVAVKRLRPLLAAADSSQDGSSNDYLQKDKLEKVQPMMMIDDVRRLFFKNFS